MYQLPVSAYQYEVGFKLSTTSSLWRKGLRGIERDISSTNQACKLVLTRTQYLSMPEGRHQPEQNRFRSLRETNMDLTRHVSGQLLKEGCP